MLVPLHLPMLRHQLLCTRLLLPLQWQARLSYHTHWWTTPSFSHRHLPSAGRIYASLLFLILPFLITPPPISPGSEQHSCISLDTSNWRSAPLPHGKVSASYFRRTESHICIIHPPQYHCHVLERLCSLSNHTLYDSVIVCSYIKPQHPYHHQVGHLFLLESTHLLNIWSVSNFLFRLGP